LAEPIRSDARRNRDKLLEAATASFATAEGQPVSLESIARDAGVGIGTLYRHFPSREALVEAVYRAELAEVAAAAGQLLARHTPKTALRRWMDRYASFVAAKRGMAESLHAMFDSGAMEPSQTRASIVGAVEMLLRRRRRRRQPAGRRAGRRRGVQPDRHLPGQRFAGADGPHARPAGGRRGNSWPTVKPAAHWTASVRPAAHSASY
jgi:AcrR family transcriptional regulator